MTADLSTDLLPVSTFEPARHIGVVTDALPAPGGGAITELQPTSARQDCGTKVVIITSRTCESRSFKWEQS